MRQILKCMGVVVSILVLAQGISVQPIPLLSTKQGIPVLDKEVHIINLERFIVRVPEDFSTIQAAIDAAAEGATILVRPGLYRENLQISKSLRLVGTGQEHVQLQAADENKPIIYVFSERLLQVYFHGLTLGNPHFPLEQQQIPEPLTEPAFPYTGILVWATAQIHAHQITIAGQRMVGLMLLGAPPRPPSFVPQAILENVQLIRNAVGVAGGQVLIRDSIISENIVGLFGDTVFIDRSKISRNKLVGLTLQILSGPQFIGAIEETEISWNGLGIHLRAHSESAAGSRLKLYSNRLVENEKYAIVVQDSVCPSWIGEPLPFKSAVIQIEGANNEFRGNGKGDLCPADYPWPPGFRK